MLVLLETPAGYGLFRVTNSKILSMETDEIADYFQSPDKVNESISLESFLRFKDTKSALAETTALVESKLSKGLSKFIKKNITNPAVESLAVADKVLGGLIKQKYDIDVVYNPKTQEIIRGIRNQVTDLLTGITEKDMKTMALSLSHSLGRFKLKFSPEKIDTMIIQAVALLDDLDRELNNYAMRLREWYGWHFPELGKIISDKDVYANCIKVIGFRHNTRESNLQVPPCNIPSEIEAEIKQAAEISMGTDITEEDLKNILELCDRVLELSNYRESLSTYLKTRMSTIAPNLTYMVGELIGARLISHAGSLMNLAKHPSSTVQILGAEKALFRALKTKKSTPKYGLIYHAAVVGQSAPKLKGKISRILAAKLSLCVRVDALNDKSEPTVAISNKEYVERRLEELSNQLNSGRLSAAGSNRKPQTPSYSPVKAQAIGSYDSSSDFVGNKRKSSGNRNESDSPEKKVKY
ncbi:nucleolar protein NOP5/NOP58-like pre-mRNA splicinig factor prp31 [Cryptosporidium ryanae]|uniref:nucleolar protein NOP5/NOP58-like pre-mRNA splicinig factor prp31 n=1 Tax=Cryptosporidium ryanae TaxID=515981 RepID=UPI00351A2BC3|nr:nucleolar protein NOP5/NOP58-like pre-mRNA splicinig factor prp31 [Cryptosporidium ryanae]